MKNRFGSTNEIGVFEMNQQGLVEVSNPSALVLFERSGNAPGSIVTASMEGTRPILIELQALASNTSFGNPRRTILGVDHNRVALLVAVMAHFALPRERMTVPVLVGSGLGFAGIAVIFAEDFELLGGSMVAVASVVMLLSPLVAAIVSVAVKRWGSGMHPVPFNAVAMALAAGIMGLVAALVEGHREMDRGLARGRQEIRREGEGDSEKAFHVGGAAPIEAAFALVEDEGIAAPVLPVHRDHIGMAREADAGPIVRAQGREQIGLLLVVVESELGAHPEIREGIADEFDHCQV